MHRATPATSSLRGYTTGGSRATIDQMDDNSLMQACSANMQANESRNGIECAQNYGFTSHNYKADKGADGKVTGSAEAFAGYPGGNRAFPQMGPVDDRRHRLRGLSEGDSAMNRGKDDDMQIHLAGDGMYHSAPQMVRVQLVPPGSGKANPPQSKAKASQAKVSAYANHGAHIEARLWAGLEPELQQQIDIELELAERIANGLPEVSLRAGNGGGSSGGGGTGQQDQSNKPTGQKAVNSAGKDSADFMHVKKGEARLSSKDKVRLSTSKDDDDVLHEAGGGKNYVGGTPAKHKFSKILTLAGPSVNGLARIGG
jgi:Bacteriophage Mu Gp45 spike protein